MVGAKRYEYVRLHIWSNTRQIDFVHCSSELIFLRLLNKWNRQAAAGIGISGSPSWFYYAHKKPWFEQFLKDAGETK